MQARIIQYVGKELERYGSKKAPKDLISGQRAQFSLTPH
jgi:hypothetical protein